jgi:hypothetical protein
MEVRSDYYNNSYATLDGCARKIPFEMPITQPNLAISPLYRVAAFCFAPLTAL